jgi:hypothetical protein
MIANVNKFKPKNRTNELNQNAMILEDESDYYDDEEENNYNEYDEYDEDEDEDEEYQESDNNDNDEDYYGYDIENLDDYPNIFSKFKNRTFHQPRISKKTNYINSSSHQKFTFYNIFLIVLLVFLI